MSRTSASNVLSGQTNAATPARIASTPLVAGAHQFPVMRRNMGFLSQSVSQRDPRPRLPAATDMTTVPGASPSFSLGLGTPSYTDPVAFESDLTLVLWDRPG